MKPGDSQDRCRAVNDFASLPARPGRVEIASTRII